MALLKPTLTSGQIAIDPVNGIFYYLDAHGDLTSSTLSWAHPSATPMQIQTAADVTISGDLTVSGTTVTLNAETITIEDNILILNSNATGSPTVNAGIEVERGSATNVSIRWNESNDHWEITNNGTDYYSIFSAANTELVTLTGEQTLTNKTLTSPVITGVSPTITLSGDLSGSVTLTNLGNATLNATVINNSVALGTDTTGNYMVNVAAGTGISVSHTQSEGSTATVSLNASLDNVSDVVISSASNGEILLYNGTNWVNSTPPVSDHGSLTGLSDDDHTQYLNETRHNLVDHSTAMSSVVLDDIGNVDASSPSSDQVLAWDSTGSKWINKTFTATVSTLDAVGDVTAPTPSSGDYLKWNGTAWVNDPINLGTDTTGSYMVDVTAGTGVSVSHTQSEGSTATVSIGQAVGTSDSVTFGNLTLATNGVVTLGQNGTLVFEGSTDDNYETTLTVIDPTADRTISLPNASDTLVGKATTDTFTNKTFDTAGTGNSFSINGTAISAVTGSGSVVLATSPAITTSITTGSTTFALLNTTATTINFAGGASTALNIGNSSGTNTISGKTVISGQLDVQQIREKVAASSISANAMTCDYSSSGIFNQTTKPNANFTVNFTNVPTDDNYAVSFTIMVTQGTTWAYPNQVSINGASAAAPKWPNGNTAPTAYSTPDGKIDIFTFTILRTSGAWTVFGSYNLNY